MRKNLFWLSDEQWVGGGVPSIQQDSMRFLEAKHHSTAKRSGVRNRHAE